MPFVKGDKRSGPPKGQPSNFTKNKPWRDAINRAIKQYNYEMELKNEELKKKGKKPKNPGDILNECASALLKASKGGDIFALKELGDRLDGKALQQVDLEADVTGHITISTTDAEL